MAAEVTGNYFRIFRFEPTCSSLQCSCCAKEIVGDQILIAIFTEDKRLPVASSGAVTRSLKFCKQSAPSPTEVLDLLDELFYSKKG